MQEVAIEGAVSEGDRVAYNTVSWGPCTGDVLVVNGEKVLVQDLHPHGAREWIALSDITERRPVAGVELTPDEQRGVAAITYLQALRDITIPVEEAIAAWRGMDAHERNNTLIASAALSITQSTRTLRNGDLELTLTLGRKVVVPRRLGGCHVSR